MKGIAFSGRVHSGRFNCHFVVFSSRSDREYSLQQAYLKELASNEAVVPEIRAFEIANSIFVSYSKRKRISEPQIQKYLSLLKALPIRVETQTLWANVDLESLASHRKLAAYDAAYLNLARHTRLPLATSDGPLRQAAIAEGISVLG